MSDIIFPDGTQKKEPIDGYCWVGSDGKKYKWDGLIGHWVDDNGEIFKPISSSAINLPHGYTYQPSLFSDAFENNDEYQFWGDSNKSYTPEKNEDEKKKKTGGCECGIWASRDGGIHSSWCPLAEK